MTAAAGLETRRSAGSNGRAHSRVIRAMAGCAILLVFAFPLFIGEGTANAQQSGNPDYSRNPQWFPQFYGPYLRRAVPPPQLSNSARLSSLLREGKITLSMRQLVAAVVENNLDLVAARYNDPIAGTDILRAKSGQAPRGLQGAPIPSGLFAGAIGLGLGQASSFLGGIGTGGGISSQGRSLTIPPSGTFDPVFFLNFSYDHTEVPLNTVRIAGVPVVTAPTTFLQGSYQQAFTSGTTFTVSLSNQLQRSTQQFLIYNPSLVSRFSLAVTQQLLNGFGFAVNRRFQDVAHNNGEIARELFRQSAITTVAHAQNSYWDMVGARENVRTADQILAIAKHLYEDDQKRVQLRTLSALELVTDEAEIAARQRDLISAQADLQTKEIALKNLFAKQLDSELSAALIEAVDPLPEPKDSDMPNLADALSAAMRNRPELRKADQTVQNQGIVVRFTKSNLKPTLTAFGLLAASGLSGDSTIPGAPGSPGIVIPGGLRQALSQVGRFKYPEYAFGITLTIPIKNRSAQADNLRARLEERQAETSLQQTHTQIDLEVRQAVIGLMQSKAQLEAARKATELQTRLVEGEQDKLAVGASSPYRLIQMQRDLESARLAEVQAQVGYAKALVEMARSTGTALEKAGISEDEVLQGRVLK